MTLNADPLPVNDPLPPTIVPAILLRWTPFVPPVDVSDEKFRLTVEVPDAWERLIAAPPVALMPEVLVVTMIWPVLLVPSRPTPLVVVIPSELKVTLPVLPWIDTPSVTALTVVTPNVGMIDEAREINIPCEVLPLTVVGPKLYVPATDWINTPCVALLVVARLVNPPAIVPVCRSIACPVPFRITSGVAVFPRVKVPNEVPVIFLPVPALPIVIPLTVLPLLSVIMFALVAVNETTVPFALSMAGNCALYVAFGVSPVIVARLWDASCPISFCVPSKVILPE